MFPPSEEEEEALLPSGTSQWQDELQSARVQLQGTSTYSPTESGSIRIIISAN